MNDETQQQTNELLKGLDDPATEKEVAEKKSMDPLESLKLDLFEFFKKRLNHIEAKERFSLKVQEKIEEKLEHDELTIDQLMAVYRLFQNKVGESSDSILGLFRPVPGATSPLVNSMTHREEGTDEIQRMFESMDNEQLQNMDQAYRVFSEIMKRVKTGEAETVESQATSPSPAPFPMPETDSDSDSGADGSTKDADNKNG